VIRVQFSLSNLALLKRLSKVDMTDCHDCGEKILGKLFRRKAEVGHTVQADGQRDTHFSEVPICKGCRRAPMMRRAKYLAIDTALVIASVFEIYVFLNY
jgi:hypothetical protein